MLNLTIALDGIVGSLRPPPYPTYAAPFGAAFFLPRESAPPLHPDAARRRDPATEKTAARGKMGTTTE